MPLPDRHTHLVDLTDVLLNLMADLVELLKAIDSVWEAHRVAVLNGGGSWSQHVEPAIYVLQKTTQDFKKSLLQVYADDKKEEKVMYAAGFTDKKGDEIGMFAGPTEDLETLLNQVPPFDQEKRSAWIIKFISEDDWEGIYKWDNIKNNWQE